LVGFDSRGSTFNNFDLEGFELDNICVDECNVINTKWVFRYKMDEHGKAIL